MIFADDIRQAIIKLADERGVAYTFTPSELAKIMDKDNWRMLTEQVMLVVGVLVQEGKLRIITWGKTALYDHQHEIQLLKNH